MKVYWGMTATRSYIRTIPADESVMISAGSLWNDKRKSPGFIDKRYWIWPDFALDSGGFVALNKWGDYPFTAEDYLNLIDHMQPSWAASMDYPCEPDIAKGTKLSVNERIMATVEYAVYLSRRNEKIIPVLQGYTPDEYEQCYRLLSSKMRVTRLALGSVCKRQSTREIADLCWELTQFLPAVPIHGFGVKLRALAFPETWALFSSIDTNAWEFYHRTKYWPKNRDYGRRFTDAEVFREYREKIESLVNKPRQLMLKPIDEAG